MQRPEIILAMCSGWPSDAVAHTQDAIEKARSHKLGLPPLLYTCLDEIGELLATRTPSQQAEALVLVLLPEVSFWPTFAHGMSLATNNGLYRAPLLELASEFPEAYWIFMRHPNDSVESEGYRALASIPDVRWDQHIVDGDAAGRDDLRRLIESHRDGFRSLFDPTGLRAAARRYLTEPDSQESSPHRAALSIEDESSFALFNGYALFRRGFSTYIASTFAETERRLTDAKIELRAVIEDVFLNFRDKAQPALCEAAMLPRSKEAPDRLLQRRMTAFPPLRKHGNGFYHLVISAAERTGSVTDVLWASKPYGGMLAPELDRANAPTPTNHSQSHDAAHDGHGKPGVLHGIAETLVRRAGDVLSQVNSNPTAAIQAAVLALEARRCLGDAKSALALAALSLQHRAEVMADCMFIGRMEDLNADRRLEDAHSAVQRIIRRGDARRSTAGEDIQRLDAMIHIATEMGAIYDAYGQFDEAESLRQAVSRYQLDIRMTRAVSLHEPVAIPELLSLPGVAVKYYVVALLRSGWYIAGASLLWVVVFGLIYALGGRDSFSATNVAMALLASGFLFVSGSAPPVPSPAAMPTLFTESVAGQFAFQFIAFLNCLWGFIHLGILIAYLYSKVARK